MRIKVRAFGELIAILGDELIIELYSNSKIKDLISTIEKKINLKNSRIKEINLERSDLSILLNGRNIQALKKFETPLENGDLVILLPPLIGG